VAHLLIILPLSLLDGSGLKGTIEISKIYYAFAYYLVSHPFSVTTIEDGGLNPLMIVLC